MTGQPDYSGSCMLALWVPADVAAQLAVPGGLDPAQMHVTVAYTGDCADVDQGALLGAAASLAPRAPIGATISGHARFTGSADGDVIVALVDSPQLDVLRRDAEAALAGRGIGMPSEHGFTAHITICYLPPDAPDPVGRLGALPVTFGAVSADWGPYRTDFLFTGADGDVQARERAIWNSLAGVLR